MSKVSGHGGYWYAATDGDLPTEPPRVHNAYYEVDIEEEIRETRSVGCGGWTEGLPKVKRVNGASFRVAEDDLSYPQVLGFTEGTELTVWLKRGALYQFDKLTATIVASVVVRNDQKKARWVEVVCKHGRYERNVEPPVPEEEEEEEE